MNPDDVTQPYVPPPPEFPRPFGRYELLARLGEGGMGTVYLARPLAGGPEVALKTPLPRDAANRALRERFYREYLALRRFRHPGFAPVMDFGECDGLSYFTMGFVRGKPLDKMAVADAVEAARLVRAVAEAMEHAHSHGIVHRDLKPANIIVQPDGRPVVVDFGIAKFLDNTPGVYKTVVGTSIGTYPYMPPEQIEGDPDRMGPRSDVYSLGVVLYKLLTGQLPFRGRGEELKKLILFTREVLPSVLVPGLDPRLDEATARALRKTPADRIPSMAAFAALLAPVAGAPPGAPAGVAGVAGYEFVGPGATAPEQVGAKLYLDVGNDLRPGVLDHHHRGGVASSATRLVTLHPELVRAAAASGEPVTVVLHEHPDLDCVAASYLAAALLSTGSLPPYADKLAEYLDRVDSGAPMFTLRRPNTLYAAFMTLAHRMMAEVPDPAFRWSALVHRGHRLVEDVLTAAAAGPLGAVDAFACPVLTKEDRAEVIEDAQRYERKLAAPATRARRATLTLPTAFGTTVQAGALFVRGVQDEGDPDRCLFFKDWARTDEDRCPDARGFEALCVWMSAPVPRCIVSVRPDGDGKLLGLAAALDAAETAARAGTGRERTGPPRPGYDNADPWYDGRAHQDTIVDSPRSGTVLSADEVERIVLEFGRGTARPLG